MLLIPHTFSPILTHKFSGSLDVAHVELVSMVKVNNWLLPAEIHELQNIIKRDPKINDLLLTSNKKCIITNPGPFLCFKN